MARVFVVTPPQAVQQAETLDAPAEADDSTLSPQERRDARLIADRLQTLIPFDSAPALYSSDLVRAAQTMGSISEAFEICPTYLGDLRAAESGDQGQEEPEAVRERVERAYSAVTMIEADPADDRIVVTHGATLSWVVAAWLRIPIEACLYSSFHVRDGSITVLEETGDRGRVLRALGDCAHLMA